MNKYLGKMVDVKIDRPIGSRHPKYNFFYPINYGYIPNTKAEDGNEIDVYVLGEFDPIKTYRGRVIGIIKRKDDNEDKLVVAKTLNSYSESDIEVLTEFQERFFDTEIISIGRRQEEPHIRITVLGLARRDNQVLVAKGIDGATNIEFYRFLGGGVDFAEESEVALKREFLEEIEANIVSSKYLCKVEDIFQFEGQKKHEIILVYEIELPQEFYNKDEMVQYENGIIGKALWVDKNDFLNGDKKIVPLEIMKYL